MAIFNRKKEIEQKPEPKQETRFIESDYGYSYPLSLSLLKSGAGVNASSAFYGAISLISNSIAEIPIHLRRKDTGEILYDHPVTYALENGLTTRFTLIRQMVSDMLNYGSGFAYIDRNADGSVREIVYLPHDSISIDYNPHTRRLFYLSPMIKKGRLEPINVLHILRDSKDGVNGIGMSKIAGDALRLAKAADKSAREYFDSNCSVNALLKSTRPLTNQQRADIHSSWMSTMSGEGSHLAVIGSDLDYTPISDSAANAQMIEARTFQVTEICRFFNISPFMLGALEHSQYGSLEQAHMSFYSECLLPIITMMTEEFNRKLFKPSERALYEIEWHEEHILKGDKQAMASYYSTLANAGILSRNECREELGYKPSEDAKADELLIPYSDAGQNSLNENDNTNTDNIEENENSNIQ